ncbi:DNA adenine methylase [Pantoea agglomerans]|uniref:DNA adenine methylase n=1 Tax=Enterobacter agglomerans TaxID=549 RepID=UPI00155891F2|nr:DNA adenine methylase [Pantoea agglomerans]NQS82091.1 DNA adenine methylase [Pantoea agglomerans]
MQTYDKIRMDFLKKQAVISELGLPKLSSSVSPFRYPGGKGKLSRFLALFIATNNLQGCMLVEPFCGGAGGTLPLLLAGLIDKLYLNDLNAGISGFWESLKNNPSNLIDMVEREPVNIESWHHWRNVYFSNDEYTPLEKGFSAFFLNRTNRSGMLHAGPIGGREQKGDYKIDCRFNRVSLIKKLEKISNFSNRIIVTNNDAIKCISRLKVDTLIYADPPYVKEGRNIYNEFCFTDSEHLAFSKALKRSKSHWLLSYDDHPLIHKLYSSSGINIVELSYAINKARIGRELLIASTNSRQPSMDFCLKEVSFSESPQECFIRKG